MSDLSALDRALRENHLTKPRPAPIPFPVSAGVHDPDFAEAQDIGESPESHQPNGGAVCAGEQKERAA